LNSEPIHLDPENETINIEPEFLSSERSSYRQIFKATSLFGGVQVFNILIGMIRVKFVAVLLGTAGVGIMGLLNAPLQLIISVTGLGITFSAVRDISEAHESGDEAKISRTIIILRRWSWAAGLLGSLVTIILAPLLSRWSFGNSEYTWAFVWLSITLLMQTISNSQIAIIQGTRRLKNMAKASAFGSLAGLFTAVPLFYYFGVKGIVPSLIFTALTSLVLSWYFSYKISIKPIEMSFKDTFYGGKNMVKLGLVVTSIGIIGFLTGYILSAFISKTGGVNQVGLYNAGWSIIGQSTGLVFIAMTTDFFPRLSAINKDENKVGILVNQQAQMVLIILGPILILLTGAMPLVIKLLYTPAFLSVIVFANWLLLGTLLKGLVWPVGFIFAAKGDLKLFGLIEISALFFNTISNIAGYSIYGLEGLGMSFIINYLFGLTLTLLFAKKKYGFKYDKQTVIVFLLSSVFVILGFIISHIVDRPGSYVYISIVLVISVIYSFSALDKRVGLRTIIFDFFEGLSKR
jgi:O-antigen/teichoic acid export membrane protein